MTTAFNECAVNIIYRKIKDIICIKRSLKVIFVSAFILSLGVSCMNYSLWILRACTIVFGS